MECCLTCCLSPFTSAIIALGAVVIIVLAAAGVYIPTYLHYVDGCIVHPSNGTLLSNNLYSTAFNFAAGEGNSVLFDGLDEYHSLRAANCSGELQESARLQRRDAEQLRFAKAEAEDAYASLDLLRRCLDAAATDAAADARRRAGVAGLADVPPLAQLVGAPRCAAVDANLSAANAVYNCSALPDCVSTCNGPSREITAAFCQRCGCHAEWLAHGMLLQVLLALFVFLCVNATRTFFVEGLHKLLWRQISTGRFEFFANCDIDGVANVGRREVRDALVRAMRGQARMGVVFIVLAAACNLPWVLALRYVGANLRVQSMRPSEE